MNSPMLIALMFTPLELVILLFFISPKKTIDELAFGVLVISIFGFAIFDSLNVMPYTTAEMWSWFINSLIANTIVAVIIYLVKKWIAEGVFKTLWDKLIDYISISIPQDLFKIDFNKKNNRKANVFGVVIGIIGFLLYEYEIVQRAYLYGFESILAVLFGGACYFLGLMSGIFFISYKKRFILLVPILSLLIHAYFFGDYAGDRFHFFIGQIFLLIISIGIVVSMFLIIKYTIKYIESGK